MKTANAQVCRAAQVPLNRGWPRLRPSSSTGQRGLSPRGKGCQVPRYPINGNSWDNRQAQIALATAANSGGPMTLINASVDAPDDLAFEEILPAWNKAHADGNPDFWSAMQRQERYVQEQRRLSVDQRAGRTTVCPWP